MPPAITNSVRGPYIQVVDNFSILDRCLQALSTIGVTKLAIDLEGVELSRSGRVSLIQIMSNFEPLVWIIDVTTLAKHAFEYMTSTGWSLRMVLENPLTVKMLFDVRNDSDSLYNIYGIMLSNVCDLQLLEVAVRRSNNIKAVTIAGLKTVITKYLDPGPAWKQVKEQGNELFKTPESRLLVEVRPLDKSIIKYAAQDVTLLFELADELEGRIGDFEKNWVARVGRASLRRVKGATKPPPKNAGSKKAKKTKIFAPEF